MSRARAVRTGRRRPARSPRGGASTSTASSRSSSGSAGATAGPGSPAPRSRPGRAPGRRPASPRRQTAMVRSVSSASVSSLTPPTSSRIVRRNAPTAPGMVGMQCPRSKTRRSTLNPMTYSMCCQRAEQTAPVGDLRVAGHRTDRRVRERLDEAGMVSGAKIVSPSIITTSSWRACAMPLLSAEALPPLVWRSTRTPGSPSASTMSAVPSVEPSSTTITSTGWSRPRAIAPSTRCSRSRCRRARSPTTGSATGGPHGRPRR